MKPVRRLAHQLMGRSDSVCRLIFGVARRHQWGPFLRLQIVIGLVVSSVGLPALAAQTKAADAKKPPACVIGDHALTQGQPQLALDEYQKCLSQVAPSSETLSNLGMAYAGLKQFEQAIRYYLQALALNPDSSPTHLNLGLAYLKANHAEEAAKEFARSLMEKPGDPKALELLAMAHYQLKDFELSAYEAELVHKALPNEASAAFLLGSSYLRLGLYRRAVPLIYESVSNSNSPDAHVTLGEAFLGVKAYRQALDAFQKAESLSPNLKGIHADTGTAYMGLGQVEKATAEFKKELALDPDNFKANYYLGRLERMAGDDASAQKHLGKAQQLRPGDASVAYEYAVLAMQAGDYAKAASLLEGILQKVPNYLDARVLLAQTYFRLHRTQDGKRESALVNAMKRAAQARTDAEGQKVKETAAAAKAQADQRH